MEVLEGGDDLDGVEVRRVDAEPAGRPEVAEELAPGHEGEHHVEEVLVLVEPLQLDEEGVLQREIVISRLMNYSSLRTIRPQLSLGCKALRPGTSETESRH